MRPGGREDSASGPPGRRSKGQRRIDLILERIPDVRDQLEVAIQDLAPTFTAAAVQAAAQSPDPRERNEVAVIERELDVLIAWLEELASRGLDEAQRLDSIPKTVGHPWERLAALGVISRRSAERLQDAKEIRNTLAHAYPPASWRALHESVETLLAELDSYQVKVSTWLADSRIVPD